MPITRKEASSDAKTEEPKETHQSRGGCIFHRDSHRRFLFARQKLSPVEGAATDVASTVSGIFIA